MSPQDSPSTRSRFRAWTPFAILLFSLTVRLYFWPAGLFHTDSVIAAQAAEATVADGRLHYLQGQMGYPGYSLFVSSVFYVWHLATGAESAEWILIFSSVILGSILPVLVFLFTMRLSGRYYAALYASVAFSLFPLSLSLSTYVKDQMLWGCLLVSAFIFAHSAGSGGGLRDKILSWGFLCAALITRQQAVLIVPAFLVVYAGSGLQVGFKDSRFTFRLSRSAMRDLAVCAAATAAVFLVAFAPKAAQDPGFSIWDDFVGNSVGKVLSIRPLSQNFTGVAVPWVVESMGAPASLLAVFGAFYSMRRGGMAWLSMLLWFASTVFFIGHIHFISPYLLFDALIPVAVFLGWGLSVLRERHRFLADCLVVVACLWMVFQAAPVLSYRSGFCGPCSFAESVANATGESSLVFAGDESPHMLYYGRRGAPPIPPDPMDSAGIDRYFDSLDSVLAGGAGMYVTDTGWANDVHPSDLFKIDTKERVIFRGDSGRRYSNLEVVRMEPITVRDRQTNFTFEVGGVFMLEALNRFRVGEAGSFDDENFHRTDLQSQPFKNRLFRISARTNAASGS
jgi:hypothetical protein